MRSRNHTDWADIDTPLGRLMAVAEGGTLTGLYFHGQKHFPAEYAVTPTGYTDGSALSALLEQARFEIAGFFAHERRSFALSVNPKGTVFQRRVWDALRSIGWGETVTYAAIAQAIGQPSATRAVANAIGRNPISIVIPCHRVIGKDGSLTGYAGGLDRKAALLQLEAH